MVLGEPQILGQMKQAVRSRGSRRIARSRAQPPVPAHVRGGQGRAHANRHRQRVDLDGGGVGQARRAHLPVDVGPAAAADRRRRDDRARGHAFRRAAARSRSPSPTARWSAAASSPTRFGAEAITLNELPDRLPEFDIIVTCTASTLPILGKGLLERVVKARRHAPVFIVDLAVPRDVEPEAAELDDVFLYSVDDLAAIVKDNLADPARVGGAGGGDDRRRRPSSFLRWLEGRAVVPTITALHGHHDALRAAELERARKHARRRRGAGAGAGSARARPHQQVPARADAGAEPGGRRRTRRAGRAVPAHLPAARRPASTHGGPSPRPSRASGSSDVAAHDTGFPRPRQRRGRATCRSHLRILNMKLIAAHQARPARAAPRRARRDAARAEDATRDLDRYRALSKEHAEIDPIVALFREYRAAEADLADRRRDRAAIRTMRAFADEERAAAPSTDRGARGRPAAACCCRRTPNDERNVFLEIRAGTGGDESALFAGDLFRMYTRFAERNRWQVEIVSESSGELGGYKEVIARIAGQGRVFEAQVRVGRPSRAARAGDRGAGAHPHVGVHGRGDAGSRSDRRHRRSIRPTCASTRSARPAPAASTSTRPIRRCASRTCPRASSSSARTTARSTAIARRRWRCWPRASLDKERRERQQKEAATRKSLIGSGDRSERIRTYNFPQGRVTDHRINLTLYKIDAIMDGDLDELIDALAQEFQAEQLAALAGEKHDVRQPAPWLETLRLDLREFVPATAQISVRLDHRSARDALHRRRQGSDRARDRGNDAPHSPRLPDALSRPRLVARVASRHRRVHRLVHAQVRSGQRVEVEIGYRLLPDAWGRGFATEGARAARALRLRRPSGSTGSSASRIPDNVASQNVLMKVGTARHRAGAAITSARLRVFAADNPQIRDRFADGPRARSKAAVSSRSTRRCCSRTCWPRDRAWLAAHAGERLPPVGGRRVLRAREAPPRRRAGRLPHGHARVLGAACSPCRPRC